MYLLSGGFGYSPTNLLHYNYLLHPLIGFFIKNLFILFPSGNGYSIFLLTAHYCGTALIIYCILKAFSSKKIYCYGIITVLLLEIFFLMHPTFTSAASMLTFGGIAYLLSFKITEKLKAYQYIIVIIFFIAASLFRIYILIPLLLVCLPLFFNKIFFKPLLIIVIISTLCILIFNIIHVNYYEKKISDWNEEDEYREAYFGIINFPYNKDLSSSKENYTSINLLEQGFIPDKNYLKAERLQEIKKEIKIIRPLDKSFLETLYWYFMNNKIYALSVLIGWFLLKPLKDKCRLLLFSFTIIIATVLFLYCFIKLPDYLLSCLLFLYFLLYFFNSKERFRNRFKVLKIFSLTVFFGFASFKILKINSDNIQKNQSFKNAFHEVNKYSDKLFAVTDDSFPFDQFAMLDNPQNYKIKNVVNKDHLLNNTHTGILKKFGISSEKELLSSSEVLFWGKFSDNFKEYIEQMTGKKIDVFGPLSEFKSAEVRRIAFKN